MVEQVVPEVAVEVELVLLCLFGVKVLGAVVVHLSPCLFGTGWPQKLN